MRVPRKPITTPDSKYFREFAELREDQPGITWESIDPSIRDLVRDLNFHGYETWYSCSGGEEHMSDIAGIAFHIDGPLSGKDRRVLRDIVELYTDVPYRIDKKHERGFYELVFRGPILGPSQ